MDKSDSISELAKALHKAQSSIKTAIKDANNPFFKSKYADLGAIWDACRDALQANGLSVAQVPTTGAAGLPCLDTILMHSSGQWLSGQYPITPIKNDPQGVGSAITYARRYALQAIVGICADLDDDGEAAAGRTRTSAKVNSVGEAVKKKPSWTEAEKTKAGEIRGALMGYGPGGEEAANTIWRDHAYDEPAVVLAAMQSELNEWSK